MDIPHPLVEEFARGHGVIFVGAGLSQGAGLPGWRDLIAPLAVQLPNKKDTDLPKIAQLYAAKFGRSALVNEVVKKTSTTNKQPSQNHRRLAQLAALGTYIWITTNYDDFLERAFKDAGLECHKIVRDTNLPIQDEGISIFKLHGDREQPDTIVITQDDFADFPKQGFESVSDCMEALLAQKTFLFVGYSISDPDFRRIRNKIHRRLGDLQRFAYAVFFDADEVERDDLHDHHIAVLNIPSGGQTDFSRLLGEFLDPFIEHVRRAKENPEAKDTGTRDAAEQSKQGCRAPGDIPGQPFSSPQPLPQPSRLTRKNTWRTVIAIGFIVLLVVAVCIMAYTGIDFGQIAAAKPTESALVSTVTIPTSTAEPTSPSTRLAANPLKDSRIDLIIGESLTQTLTIYASSQPLDPTPISVKGNTWVSVTVRGLDRIQTPIPSEQLTCGWQLPSADRLNKRPDTGKCFWSFRPPTDVTTYTLMITASDSMKNDVTISIPFIIAAR